MYSSHSIKKYFFMLATIGAVGAIAQSNPNAVLMTIDKKPVTVAEFNSVYHKNNTPNAADNKSLNEYLDLFVNFKLKVKEAEELGLDTAKSFRDELAGYRKQLAQPYLTDKEVNEKLLQETYNRMKEEIRASHILVRVTEDAFPKDTLEAYNKIMKIRARILKGEDFNKVAKEKGISDDPSAKENGGDLGYFTAMQMVYPFESVCYSTKVGEISMPVRTRFGYHIIKVSDRRPSQGEIQVAHIMVKTAPNFSKEDSLNAYTKITELYNKLKAGSEFEALAQEFSDDKPSAKKGGELPWFGAGKMPTEFEKIAFGMKNKGEYSEPFQSKYGWHIIKFLDKRGLAKFDDIKNELKAKVTKDSRAQVGKTALIAKIKSENKFKENLKMVDELVKIVDTNFFNGTWDASKAKALNKVIFNLNEKNYTQTDFAAFLNNHQSKRAKMDIKMAVYQLYKQYVDETTIAYQEALLDTKYPDFKNLMQEYRDGILLFELTDEKVWGKAVRDTTGAKDFYERNKNSYMWEQRAEATVYTCLNEKVAKQVRDLLKKKKTDKEILSTVNKESQLNLSIETKIYNKGENEFVDANWNPGLSADIKSAKENKTIVVNVSKLLKPEPKLFNEAKGLITADYQAFLEQEWIASLKKKYVVSIDKSVLSTLK